MREYSLKEFKEKAKKDGFTRQEMWDGIIIDGLKFTIDTIRGGRYWTVRVKDLKTSKWETLCTRALITTAFNKVEQRLANR